MKPTKTSHILAILLLAFTGVTPAMAQEHLRMEERNIQVSTADRIARTLIQSLPDSNTKNGLLRYYSILNPSTYVGDGSVGIKNSGIANFFEHHFQKNTCFAETAYEFYHEINTSTRQTQQVFTQTNNRHHRPSLADKAGRSHPQLRPGWLFEKAMQHTNGNANAAITLIGLCGHDDIDQGNYFNGEALDNLTTKGFSTEKLLQVPAQGITPATPSFCPQRGADFFVSDSLGRNTDIHDSLKQKILTYQYPGKKAQQIAAKNYHTLGAAFMTCQMIEAGLHPRLAIQVETTAASIYRGIRLCQNIEQPALLFRLIQKSPEIRMKPKAQNFEDFVIEQTIRTGKSGVCTQATTAKNNAYCQLLESLGLPARLEIPRLEERARQQIEKNIENIIASGVYASWTISGDIAGVSLPCTRDQILGPHPFLKWLVSKGQLDLNLCGQGLSAESCRKALTQIRAWEVDFDWTISQHRLGAEFAAKHCKSSPQKAESLNFCSN